MSRPSALLFRSRTVSKNYKRGAIQPITKKLGRLATSKQIPRLRRRWFAAITKVFLEDFEATSVGGLLQFNHRTLMPIKARRRLLIPIGPNVRAALARILGPNEGTNRSSL